MFNQKKVMDRRIFKPIRMLSILLLAVLIPLTGYTADLDADLINAVLQADTAPIPPCCPPQDKPLINSSTFFPKLCSGFTYNY
jgi:hypothetical protein